MRVTLDVAEACGEADLDFACKHCGWAGRAVVRERVRADAPQGATGESSAEIAKRRAEHGLAKALARSSLIVRCPSCGRIRDDALATYRRGRAFACLVIALMAAPTALMAWLATSDGPLWVWSAISAMTLLCVVQPITQAIRPPAVEVTFPKPSG